MITQNQFPFEGIAGTGNKAVKIALISLAVLGLSAGIYFTLQAIRKHNKAKADASK